MNCRNGGGCETCVRCRMMGNSAATYNHLPATTSDKTVAYYLDPHRLSNVAGSNFTLDCVLRLRLALEFCVFCERVCAYVAQRSNTSTAGCVHSTPCPTKHIRHLAGDLSHTLTYQITPGILSEYVQQKLQTTSWS
jgi:hypothetical protein